MIMNHYLEQHDNIREQVKLITSLLEKRNLQENASEIALEINKLAGVIKVHLSSEDQFLYPKLINGTDESIQKKAKEYQQEMGNLMEVFTIFKQNYNTKSRILEHADTLNADFDQIVKQLFKRMEKEEKDLYKTL